MSPVEIRRKNGFRQGSITATGQVLDQSVGLMDSLEACAKSEEATASVRADLAAGRALRIQGTPTFVIGDRTYPGRVPPDVVAAALGEPTPSE